MSDSVEPVDALVMVDVQCAFFEGPSAVPRSAELLVRIRALLSRARAARALVVHLQNDGAPGAVDEPYGGGWELHIAPAEDEPVIRKTDDDGFAGTDLERILSDRARRLAVVGAQSEMCVAATARTALAKGFQVVLPSDAHGTYPVPPGDGYPDTVPADVVARVAEWSLGDTVELVAESTDVRFRRVCAS